MRLVHALIALCALLVCTLAGAAEPKQDFKVAWSIYVGWMPWDYAAKSGIMKKWAERYGIAIELVRVDDYVTSLKQYAAGRFDACAMTNIDMLTIPAAAGVDSTAVIVGDFSNGNDGIVLKGRGKTLPDIKGQPVNLVEFSVSHYLLARGLDTVSLTERDVKIIDTSDARIVQAFAESSAVVTWKPQLADILSRPDATLVFDSGRIPGEIIDLMVVQTDVLKANPHLGRALVGAWYETMSLMSGQNARATAALTAMAKASGTDLAGFRRQLATTRMFALPAEAHGFMSGSKLARTMELVRAFAFSHDLLGKGTRTIDAIGIQFPRGETLGNAKNVKVRFDASYTRIVADGKL